MKVHINVKNFGPIEEAEIDLRPLTVFVGESNTGKTYLATLIYTLHRHFGGIPQFPWADSVSTYFSF
ncbi:ATP-binding protein, partial [Candidatus Poribacteria bacterium]|nr:ATP-binding protein [Candidatus Poribacteria bacterium]